MPERERDEAAPARAMWSGTITFGLVNIPVDLYAAVRARRTSMKMVDRKGHALGREYYCPEDGKKLSPEQIVRGYEAGTGEMIVVTDEELEAVAPEITRDIELRRFVPAEQIAPAYFQRPYFLAPSGRSTKAYHLLAKTMERTGRVGVGTFVMRGHQYLVAILSDGGVLRAATLRFADELRAPGDADLPKPAKAPAKAVSRLSDAIEALTHKSLDAAELGDRYASEIHALVETKAKQRKDVIDISGTAEDEDEDQETSGAEVIDLVKLLKQRLSAKATVKAADAPRGNRKAKRPAPGAKEVREELEALSKESLYERAQKLDIPGRSKMGRAQLVKAIRKAAGK